MGLEQAEQTPVVDLVEIGLDVGIDHMHQSDVAVGLHAGHRLRH